MIKSTRVVEWTKTALIVLFAISAIVLGWRTRLFNDIVNTIPLFGNVAESMRGMAGTGGETGGVPLKEAARPLCIVITNEDGERYGVRYDTDARNAVYDRTSSIIGEALGSAAALSEISELEWRTALSGLGVYYEYKSPVCLSVLDGWLRARMTEPAEELTTRRIIVAIGDDRSRIYFQDHQSGLFYGADTASAAGKAQELEIYSENGARFAYELGSAGSDNAPYMLIMPDNDHAEVYSVSAGTPMELLNITLAAMGHSSETYRTLPEGEGALRCVGMLFDIILDMRGRAVYRNTDNTVPPEDRQPLSRSEMIERARVITAGTIAGTSGNAEVFFAALEYEDEETCSIYFNYFIAGGFVSLLEDGNAARITFVSGLVTEIELIFRTFSFSDDSVRLLPEKQALAAAGGQFALCYPDTGADRLSPTWVRN